MFSQNMLVYTSVGESCAAKLMANENTADEHVAVDDVMSEIEDEDGVEIEAIDGVADENEAKSINEAVTEHGEPSPMEDVSTTAAMIDNIDEATIVEDPSPTSFEACMYTRFGKFTESNQLRPFRPRDFHRLHLQHTVSHGDDILLV